jgi:hypothetical protein
MVLDRLLVYLEFAQPMWFRKIRFWPTTRFRNATMTMSSMAALFVASDDVDLLAQDKSCFSQAPKAISSGDVRDWAKSRRQESEQDDKWSFCLTAGTLCPASQERP